MLLSYNELVGLVQDGVVESCPLEYINGASIDVSLSDVIFTEDGHFPHIVDFSKREPLKLVRQLVTDYYDVVPGEFLLAATQQVFNLPPDIAMEFKLKSSTARRGLNHLSAGWADPTWNGSALTLELHNTTRFTTIRLRPGDRVGQVCFFRCAPVPAEYSYARRGRYNGDRTAQPIKK